VHDVALIQQRIHYQFQQVKHLEIALTHSSCANEAADGREHNERYEFLGDAVLELCVTQQLFERFPQSREGELTRLRARLVSKPSLAALAREMGLDGFLLLGKGEESQGGRQRPSLLANVFEAVLGGIYLDGGMEAACAWVQLVFATHWPDSPLPETGRDNKSLLQERTQQVFKARPVYTLLDSRGPEHEKVFEVQLTLPDGRVVRSAGSSMKKAEQSAAGEALALLEKANGESAADG